MKSIKQDLYTVEDNTKIKSVKCEPGNCTVYRLCFTSLSPQVEKAMGLCLSSPSVPTNSLPQLVTWLRPSGPSHSYAFPANMGFLAVSYVHEKLCGDTVSRADAEILTKIIGDVLNIETE